MRLIPILTAASAALLVAACQPADSTTEPPVTEPGAESPAPTPTADANALTATGWGPVQIGMTREQVAAALGAGRDDSGVSDQCELFRPANAPEGMLVMLNNGVLARISISEPSDLQTDRGFGVGDAAADIKAAYGADAVVTPHKYQGPPSEDIFVWSGARPADDEYITDETRRGIRYEIGGDGNVSQIHIGGPDIQLVEGCA